MEDVVIGKSCLAVATLVFLAGIQAGAGTITGKIRLGNIAGAVDSSKDDNNKENVVVWLEGETDPKAPEAPLRISQKNLQFSPEFLVVTKGQKVEMPNYDDVAHNVYSFTGISQFNLGIYPKGESRSVTFDKSGVVDVFCSIHHHMHARVFVVPSRYFSSSRPGEIYSIPNVPAGSYTLKVWYERSRMITKIVHVPKDGTVQENVILDGGTQPVIASKD
jgi:plastocyanin